MGMFCTGQKGLIVSFIPTVAYYLLDKLGSEDLVEHHKTFKEGFIFRFQSSFVFWKGWVQCQFSFEEKLGDKLLP